MGARGNSRERENVHIRRGMAALGRECLRVDSTGVPLEAIDGGEQLRPGAVPHAPNSQAK